MPEPEHLQNEGVYANKRVGVGFVVLLVCQYGALTLAQAFLRASPVYSWQYKMLPKKLYNGYKGDA